MKLVGSSVIDHVAGSPSLAGIIAVVLRKGLSSMNRFISVVAGSVVPLTIKSSQSVMSAISLLSVDSPSLY